MAQFLILMWIELVSREVEVPHLDDRLVMFPVERPTLQGLNTIVCQAERLNVCIWVLHAKDQGREALITQLVVSHGDEL